MLQNFSKAGTYYVNVFSAGSNADTPKAVKTVMLTITVSDVAPTGANLYSSLDTATATNARVGFGTPASDSALTGSAGRSETPSYVAYIYPVVTTLGSYAGDSLTAGGSNFCTVQAAGSCQVVVSVSGPGLVGKGDLAAATTSRAKSITASITNSATLGGTDTIVVFSDGTAGTGTITFSMGSVTLATKTVTFFGSAATITPYYGDTIIAKGAATSAVKARVKDASGNLLTTGTIYAYSSDTAVISDSATACSYSSTAGMHVCNLTAADTGTATITLRNAASVSGSTISSTALSFTVRGTLIKSATVAFDKTSYAPGEKAVITITAKDVLGNSMNNGTISSAFVVTQNLGFSSSTGTATDFVPYLETGIETRVVYMPTVAGTLTYTLSKGSGAWDDMAAASASVTIVDATKDAADAATDAALEATDAAYAAQDAAQLAAEAADAATAAAEAATAAVEDLATQVASLFADLQKQITTLANVVAKIAKKVKA